MSWPKVPASELMLKRGGSVNPANYPDETFELLSIPAFDRGEPEIVEGKEIGSSKSCVQTNDVLLSKIVPHIRRCWVVPAPQGTYRQIGSGEWIIFRNDNVHPPFLRHFLTSDIFHKQFMNTTAGVGGSLVRARPAEVGNIEVPLPPLTEQKRIAAILDKADAIRRKRQQAIQLANDFLRAVFLDMFGDPATNPKGWKVSTLGELCAKITDGEHGTVKRLESGKLYLMARNIDRKGNLDLSEVSYISEEDHQRIYKRCAPEKGDVLLVCVGATIGKALVVPDIGEFSLARSVALLKPGNQIVSDYLLSLINTEALQRQFVSSGNSSAQAGLYLGKIKEIMVPVPDLEEQLRFRKIVDFVKEKVLSKTENGNLESDLVLGLRQKAFSGQL